MSIPSPDPLKRVADRIYEQHIGPLNRQIEELMNERDKYRDALEKISKIHWGNDCGALAIIDEVL